MFVIANIRPLGHNVGNHAINFALRNMIYDVFGRLVSIIDFPASSKYDSSSRAGLTPSVIHEINRFADGVIVGGGNLYENNEIDVDGQALKALLPPLMLFSNSRGRIYDRKGHLSDRTDVIPDEKLISLINRSDISLSRDSATHEYIKRLCPTDMLGWCPTINLRQYRDRLPPLPDKETVGTLISVRTPTLMNIPYVYQSGVLNDVEEAIDSLRELGHKRIRILCNDSRDLDFASAFRYTKKVDAIFTSDVYQYLGLLSGADFVLSYRLHATLPAIAFGTDVLNIVYDERSSSLCGDLGIEDSSLNLVSMGSGFKARLRDSLFSRATTVRRGDDPRSDWNEKSKFQFDQLRRFRLLMDDYLTSGYHSRHFRTG